jgi:hypothetical protein
MVAAVLDVFVLYVLRIDHVAVRMWGRLRAIRHSIRLKHNFVLGHQVM